MVVFVKNGDLTWSFEGGIELSFQNLEIVFADIDELQFNASPEDFTSKKITTKILQQIEVSWFHFSHLSRFEKQSEIFKTSLKKDFLKVSKKLAFQYCQKSQLPFLLT